MFPEAVSLVGKEKAEEAVRICEESSAQNKLTEEVFVAVTELEPKLPVSEHVFDQQDPVPFVLSSLAPGAKAGATHASRWSDLRSKTWPASIVNSSRHWTPKMDQMACKSDIVSEYRQPTTESAFGRTIREIYDGRLTFSGWSFQ